MALFFNRIRQVFQPKVAPAPVVPVRGPRPRPQPHRSVPAYVLVVDESSSMGSSFRMAGGRVTTRMAAVHSAARDYLQQLRAANPRQVVAVVGFSDTARLCHGLAPVGKAFRSLSQAIASLHPRGLTSLSGGLGLALDQLARTGTSRGNVVIITDGAANVSPAALPGLVSRAQGRRIRIFTIGVGNLGDSDYDKDLLFRMARVTRGRFASAHSFGTLCRALRRVA